MKNYCKSNIVSKMLKICRNFAQLCNYHNIGLKYSYRLITNEHNDTCEILEEPICLTEKYKNKDLLIYVTNLYPNNCYNCCIKICNQIKNDNHCLFNCSTTIDNLIIKNKLSDDELLSYIQNKYPNNCNECCKVIIDKIKIKYKCLFNCSIDDVDIDLFEIYEQVSDNAILNVLKKQFPKNCDSCNQKLCIKIKYHNKCIFYCHNTYDSSDINFVENMGSINFNKLNKYIREKCINSCEECSKKFKKILKKKIYYHYANVLFDDLQFLNSILTHYGYSKETSHQDAVNKIKNNIFINIYDLLDKKYDMRHATIKDLSKYTYDKKKFFPLEEANNIYLEAFLQKIICI